jgi:hypothetical protein
MLMNGDPAAHQSCGRMVLWILSNGRSVHTLHEHLEFLWLRNKQLVFAGTMLSDGDEEQHGLDLHLPECSVSRAAGRCLELASGT